MDAIQLNSTTDLLSHQVVALSDNIKGKWQDSYVFKIITFYC